jgi:hypothetical protein
MGSSRSIDIGRTLSGGAIRFPCGHGLLTESLQLTRCTAQLRSNFVGMTQHLVDFGARQLHRVSLTLLKGKIWLWRLDSNQGPPD